MEFKRNIIITGGAGFIGSHVVRLFVNKYPEYRIINLDKLTYAGNLANLKDVESKENYMFVKADICDYETIQKLMKDYNVDGIIHLAAESHVDRSIKDPFTFAQTNVMGTLTLLQAAKELFGECGYVETTFKKISDRAGVALGLLTHHYGNKEKLFLASGLDVLEHFLVKLRQATADAACGYDAVMHFCKAYLDFSVDKDSNWLVLVRCSPYSDMKTKTDREQMDSMFAQVHRELEEQIQRGIRDGSIVNVDSKATAQVIISLMVGANRTRVLTPYALPELYDETLDFVSRSIRKN